MGSSSKRVASEKWRVCRTKKPQTSKVQQRKGCPKKDGEGGASERGKWGGGKGRRGFKKEESSNAPVRGRLRINHLQKEERIE